MEAAGDYNSNEIANLKIKMHEQKRFLIFRIWTHYLTQTKLKFSHPIRILIFIFKNAHFMTLTQMKKKRAFAF